jgi:hypothetical protein
MCHGVWLYYHPAGKFFPVISSNLSPPPPTPLCCPRSSLQPDVAGMMELLLLLLHLQHKFYFSRFQAFLIFAEKGSPFASPLSFYQIDVSLPLLAVSPKETKMLVL